jgi:autotransporter adhesin
MTGALTANGGVTTTTLNTTGNASVGGNLNMTNNGKITNVQNGTAPGDAVNFGQLQDTRKMLAGGIAASTAMANIPLVDTNKTFAVGVALGGYDSQSAIAVGASYRMSPMTIVRGSIAAGSSSKTAVGVGISTAW